MASPTFNFLIRKAIALQFLKIKASISFRMMFSRRSWALPLLVFSFGEALATDTCYFPNGEVAHNGVPCGPSPSKCCDGEGLCLSNGLCFQPSGNILARSSCTDPSWSSSECTDICKDGALSLCL